MCGWFEQTTTFLYCYLVLLCNVVWRAMCKPWAGIKGFVDWIDHMQACCVSLVGTAVWSGRQFRWKILPKAWLVGRKCLSHGRQSMYEWSFVLTACKYLILDTYFGIQWGESSIVNHSDWRIIWILNVCDGYS